MFNLRKWLCDDPTADWKDVVSDPILGELRLSVEADWWEATTRVGSRAVQFLIGGEGEPDAILLAQAHKILNDYPEFERKLHEFLVTEATKQAAWVDEIRQLQIDSINLLWPKKPHVSEVMFSGPDKFRLWSCAYMNGELRNLGFDD